ncbi:MAG: RluA family pseudouridine synthase [Anaerovoracaceae bacterium]|jgi:23S rRNA pseudouridine1911/1915/1917 synthase
MKERFIYVLTEEDENISIKSILRRRLQLSSRLIRQLILCDGVHLNGAWVHLKSRGIKSDVLTVKMPEETSYFEPEDIPIQVVFEDKNLLVVNKQPGIVVHPTRGHPTGTMANGIAKYMEEKGDGYKIRFINRLDRDTSGILLIGKNSFMQDHLSDQMRKGETEKYYIAVVKGHPDRNQGTIDLPIGRPIEGDIRRQVMEGGSPSITRYKVLKRFARGDSLVELNLVTGRTHQIRVHMSFIGHPVMGDSLYGMEEEGLINRQALHSAAFICNHPVSGERLVLKAPLPADMALLIERLDGGL